MTHRCKKNNHTGSPQGVRKPWGSVGPTFRTTRGLWEMESPLVNGAHKISRAPGPRAEAGIWKEPGSDLPADPSESPGDRRQLQLALGHRHWGSLFVELVDHMAPGARECQGGIPPLASSAWIQPCPPACWYQYWDTTCQAMSRARAQLHPQQACCLKAPRAHCWTGPGSVH